MLKSTKGIASRVSKKEVHALIGAISETQLQRCVFTRIARERNPNYRLVVAYPAQGGAGMSGWGAKRKLEGSAKGFPDLAVYLPKNQYHALFIELKTAKGKPRPEQLEWKDRLGKAGFKSIILRTNSWEFVFKTIQAWVEHQPDCDCSFCEGLK